jgi:TPP-dependent pyruvate/acetoin dehydrogenase alpha subunit
MDTIKLTAVADLTHEQLLRMYRDMWRIRRFESAVAECVNRGLVAGGPHL